MRYRVKFVADSLMPPGHEWAICEKGDVTTLCLPLSSTELSVAEKEKHLEAAWAGYRALTQMPAQRTPTASVQRAG